MGRPARRRSTLDKKRFRNSETVTDSLQAYILRIPILNNMDKLHADSTMYF